MRVREAWPINFINEREIIMFDNVLVEVRPGVDAPDEVHLSSIFTIDAPGKGWASKALDWLLDLADEMNIKIEGVISPFGRDKRFAARQLWEWEKKHGFVQDKRFPTRAYQDRSVIYFPGSRTLSGVEEEHHETLLRTGRWGRNAVGTLFIAATGRIGLALRSDQVLEPGMYGLVGGAIDPHEIIREAAAREVYEELGVRIDPNQLRHLHTHTEPGFEYKTFLYPTQNEFEAYELNWENDAFSWFGPDELPDNLHPGVEALLADPKVRINLREWLKYLRGAPGGPVKPSTRPRRRRLG